MTFVVALSATHVFADEPAGADRSTPRLRGGVQVSAGGSAVSSVYSLGPGANGELGIQLARWLAVSGTAHVESAFLAGRAQLGALIQFAPIDSFELGVGGRFGWLYVWRFAIDNDTATVRSLVVRGTLRIVEDGNELLGLRPARWHLTLGAEGEVGSAASGGYSEPSPAGGYARAPIDSGALFAGGRVLLGFLL